MKIGITECGDAGVDLSWQSKMNSVDGAILITKNINNSFARAALQYADKIIVHATCTGYGGTVLEPHVPPYKEQLMRTHNQLVEKGFPQERIVIRVDPIIPTEEGIQLAKEVILFAYKLLFRRFRISVIDIYPHVRRRFLDAGISLPYGNGYQASDAQFAAIDKVLREIKEICPDIRIESCAEPKLTETIYSGCVSEYDIMALNLQMSDEDWDSFSYQRSGCLCLGVKKELLTNKKRCPHKCLYCYWQD